MFEWVRKQRTNDWIYYFTMTFYGLFILYCFIGPWL